MTFKDIFHLEKGIVKKFIVHFFLFKPHFLFIEFVIRTISPPHPTVEKKIKSYNYSSISMFEKHSLSDKIFDMMEHQCSCTNKFDKSFKHSFVIFRAWNEISSVDKLPQFRMNAAQTDWYKVASFTLNVL